MFIWLPDQQHNLFALLGGRHMPTFLLSHLRRMGMFSLSVEALALNSLIFFFIKLFITSVSSSSINAEFIAYIQRVTSLYTSHIFAALSVNLRTTESLEETDWVCQINPLYLAPFGIPLLLPTLPPL